MDFKDSLFDIKNQMLKEQGESQKVSQSPKIKDEPKQESRKEKEQRYYTNLKERELALSEELKAFMNV